MDSTPFSPTPSPTSSSFNSPLMYIFALLTSPSNTADTPTTTSSFDEESTLGALTRAYTYTVDELSKLTMESLVSGLVSLFMVFGPVIGYVSQYQEIKRRKNASGFSTLVSLILLVSNILRCFFWLGNNFDVTLVYQAIVMIIAQLIMLHLCVSLGDGKYGEGFYDGKSSKKKGFWKWTDFSYYIYFLIGFSGIVLVITTILGSSPTYFELIGFLSLSIESMLGVPQLIKNHNTKSTQGLSVTMIATWFIGDLFKTIYFGFTGAPFQFIMCGTLQLIVDVLILLQISIYKPPSRI